MIQEQLQLPFSEEQSKKVKNIQENYTGFFVPSFHSSYDLEIFIESISIIDFGLSVLGNRMKKQPNGENYYGLCPFHGEKTPSFSFRAKYNFYQCYGCGAQGGPFILDKEKNGGEFLLEILRKTVLPLSFDPFIDELSSLTNLLSEKRVYARILKEKVDEECRRFYY